MKILWMEATFGKLDRAVLRPEPGFNAIVAPNEWGKSTWCAFVTAMLYGIDTRERTTKNSLSVRERYAPWSGKPMEGVMCVEHRGRRITLERRTTGRVPMGDFRAYETDSGLPVPGMTGETCGQMLLGVEKSVFLRSAFVRFSDLPVEADEALRRRLNSLVTTGDEQGSAERLGTKLAELKRKIQYNRSGLLPQLRMELQSLTAQQRELNGLQQRRQELDDSMDREQQRLRALKTHLQWLNYGGVLEQRLRLEQAGEELREAGEELRELEARCGDLPAAAELRARLQRGYGKLDQLEEIAPPAHPWSRFGLVLAALAVFGLLTGGGMLLEGQFAAGGGLLAASAVVGMLALAVLRRHVSNADRQEKVSSDRTQRRQELEAHLEDLEARLEDAEALREARTRYQQARQRLEDLEAMAHPVEKPEEPDTLKLGREETEAECTRLAALLRQRRSQADQLQGRMEVLARQEDLQQQIDAAKARQRELEKWYRAIEYAQQALETASMELQRRFVPGITRRTGELLELLTDGEYTKLSIGGDLGISAGRPEESGVRELRWRSDGTGDQMYLALRIAVWEEICPEAPLILDDVLVRYDDERLQRTLEVLRQLGERHQIILYSCRRA